LGSHGSSSVSLLGLDFGNKRLHVVVDELSLVDITGVHIFSLLCEASSVVTPVLIEAVEVGLAGRTGTRHAPVYNLSQFLGVGIDLGLRSSSTSASGGSVGTVASIACCFCLSSLLFSSSFSFADLLRTSSLESLVSQLGLTHLCSELFVDLLLLRSEVFARLSHSSPSLFIQSCLSFPNSLPLLCAFFALFGSASGVSPALPHEEVSGKTSEASLHVLSLLGTLFVLSALSIVDSIYLILCFLAGSSISLAMGFHVGFMALPDSLPFLTIGSSSGFHGGPQSLSGLAGVREFLAVGGSTLFSSQLLRLRLRLLSSTASRLLALGIGLGWLFGVIRLGTGRLLGFRLLVFNSSACFLIEGLLQLLLKRRP